jgi:hypothetical protein
MYLGPFSKLKEYEEVFQGEISFQLEIGRQTLELEDEYLSQIAIDELSMSVRCSEIWAPRRLYILLEFLNYPSVKLQII